MADEGFICPLVNTAQDAASFVAACRYPPVGRRSYGPTRGLLYGGPDYFDHANEAIVTLAMVETIEALSNLEAIGAVPGLDGVLVGPSDLAIALGLGPTPDWGTPVMRDALNKIRDACHRVGKVAGIVCVSAQLATTMKRQGWNFIVAGTDSAMLRQAAQGVVAAFRSAEKS